MTSPQNHPPDAGARLANIPELVGNIFVCMDYFDLLRVQQACKRWRDCVTLAKGLQTVLYHTPIVWRTTLTSKHSTHNQRIYSFLAVSHSRSKYGNTHRYNHTAIFYVYSSLTVHFSPFKSVKIPYIRRFSPSLTSPRYIQSN